MKKISYNCHVDESKEGARLISLIPSKVNVTSYAELLGILGEVDTSLITMEQSSLKYIPPSVLKEENDARQIALRDLYEFTEGMSRHPNEISRANGVKVLNALNSLSCKQVLYKSMATTSHVANGVLDILNSDDFAEIVTEGSDIKAFLDNVSVKNEAFNAKRQEYEHRKAIKYDAPTLSEGRNAILDIINKKLVPYSNYKMEADPEGFSAFYTELETIITTINENVKRRKTIREKEENERKED